MPGLPERYDWGDRDKGRDRGASLVRDAIAGAQAALKPVRIISARRDDVIKCRDALRARLGR